MTIILACMLNCAPFVQSETPRAYVIAVYTPSRIEIRRNEALNIERSYYPSGNGWAYCTVPRDAERTRIVIERDGAVVYGPVYVDEMRRLKRRAVRSSK